MEKNNGGVEEKIKNKKWFGNCVKLSLYLKIKTREKLFLKLVLFYSETTCINITPQVFFFLWLFKFIYKFWASYVKSLSFFTLFLGMLGLMCVCESLRTMFM